MASQPGLSLSKIMLKTMQSTYAALFITSSRLNVLSFMVLSNSATEKDVIQLHSLSSCWTMQLGCGWLIYSQSLCYFFAQSVQKIISQPDLGCQILPEFNSLRSVILSSERKAMTNPTPPNTIATSIPIPKRTQCTHLYMQTLMLSHF